MQYLGNYTNWIQDHWLQEVLSKDGFEGKIEPTSNENKDRYLEFIQGVEAGWSLTTIYWWRYTKMNTSIEITQPPWITSQNRLSWWIVKQKPGQVQPMHVDVDASNKCNRFWIPLQDYEPGHILINEDEFIKDYKKGDVFQWGSPLDRHGSANIGLGPRVVMLVTEHL